MENLTPDDWEAIGTGLGVLIVVGVFLPTVVALIRKYSNVWPIVVLNLGSILLLAVTPKLLLALPGVVWIVSLAWAVAHDPYKLKNGKKWNPRPDEPGGSLWPKTPKDTGTEDYQPKRGDGGPRREVWE